MSKLQRFTLPVLATLLLVPPLVAQAQAQDSGDYPSRPLTVVVPYPAGGNTDLVTREVMQELGSRLGQPIIVENRPGANGIIGTSAVAKAAPDGYTLLVTIGAFSINPVLRKDLPYQITDFAPVSLIGRVNLVLAAGKEVPVTTFAQLVEYGKGGNQITYDSSGVGSALHLVGARIGQATAIDVMHVPYKGISHSLPDIISGRITFTINTVSSLSPFFNDGRLLPLAVLSSERSPQLPDTPTIAQAGYPQLEAYAWQGLNVPANTPAPIIDKLSATLAAILHDPGMRTRLAAMGLDAIGSTPAEFAQFLRDDLATAADTVRQANITLD
ncbi:MAG: tripartite tricarboxylate transporter substrate binding protein [Bacteroidales bacterium]|nr:tripartite tricarboxylate transporter substrate binding protein [Bacteroidales bacterium]